MEFTPKEKRVFELIEEDIALEDRLARDFPQIKFLWIADDVFSWMRRNHALVLDTLQNKFSAETKDEYYPQVRSDLIFHFGNYVTSAQAGVDFLYNYGKGVFSEELLKVVHTRTDQLKKYSPQRILTCLRNRLLHCPPLFEVVFFSVRKQSHPLGEGASLCPVITKRSLSAIEGEIKADSIGLWNEIKRKQLRRNDWLSPLLTNHLQEYESTFKDVKNITISEYPALHNEYREIKERRAAIEFELVALDHVRP